MTELELLANYSDFLAQLGIRHLVGGSLASSAWGEQRHTNDADLLVDIPPEKAELFLKRLPNEFQIIEDEYYKALNERKVFSTFQLIHLTLVFKIDNFVAVEDWDFERLNRSKLIDLRQGVLIPFSSAEDMIIAKCRWFDLGGRVSDRQWNDLMRLYEVRRNDLEVDYITKWLGQYELLDLWDEILNQAQA